MERPASTCDCGEHAWVRLTRGHVAFVDSAFASAVSVWNWHAIFDGKNWYAARTYHQVIDGRRRSVTVRMHTMILPGTNGLLPDHADGDTLNNRQANLRLASFSQNAANQKPRTGTTSRFRGVSRAGNSWRVVIGVNGRQKYLGKFDDEESAARAYDAAAVGAHGDYARLNFPAPKDHAHA